MLGRMRAPEPLKTSETGTGTQAKPDTHQLARSAEPEVGERKLGQPSTGLRGHPTGKLRWGTPDTICGRNRSLGRSNPEDVLHAMFGITVDSVLGRLLPSSHFTREYVAA